jgi:type IV protein arginine methyltransferase
MAEAEVAIGVGAEEEEIHAIEELGQALVSAILDRAPLSIIEQLLDADAPLWWQDADGWGALHAAAYAENEALIRLLIERGAVWNAGDWNDNLSALELSAHT